MIMRLGKKITAVIAGTAVDIKPCGHCPDGVFVWTGPIARRTLLGHVKRPERGSMVMASELCHGTDAAYSSANGHVYGRSYSPGTRTGNYMRALRYLVNNSAGVEATAEEVGAGRGAHGRRFDALARRAGR